MVFLPPPLWWLIYIYIFIFSSPHLPFCLVQSSCGKIWATTGHLCAVPQAADRYVYSILYCECVIVNQSGCFITKGKSLKSVFYVITGGNQIGEFAVCKSTLRAVHRLQSNEIFLPLCHGGIRLHSSPPPSLLSPWNSEEKSYTGL